MTSSLYVRPKKNLKTHIYSIQCKENKWDIGTSLGPDWDQWVRTGTRAPVEDLSHSSSSPATDEDEPSVWSHASTLGGSTRGKMFWADQVWLFLAWSTQGNNVSLEACSPPPSPPPPAYPRLAALALLEPLVRNIKQNNAECNRHEESFWTGCP